LTGVKQKQRPSLENPRNVCSFTAVASAKSRILENDAPEHKCRVASVSENTRRVLFFSEEKNQKTFVPGAGSQIRDLAGRDTLCGRTALHVQR
jgi:hypothetical protein